MPITSVSYRLGTPIVGPVYLDANFVVSAMMDSHEKYSTALSLLGELVAQEIPMYISMLAVDEAWWILLREWYRVDVGKPQASSFALRNPKVLGHYTPRLYQNWQNLQHWPNIVFLPQPSQVTLSLINEALSYLLTCNLTPRDAFHLALAITAGAKGFVTADSDFDNLTSLSTALQVYKF